jgi:hypothetical protein
MVDFGEQLLFLLRNDGDVELRDHVLVKFVQFFEVVVKFAVVVGVIRAHTRFVDFVQRVQGKQGVPM